MISRQREQREQERIRPESQRVAEVRPESQPGIIESQPGIIERLSEAFVPQQAGRNSYYDEAQSNSFLQASSRIASGVHPLAGWLANGIGAGLLAGVSSANPFIGLAAGGASLISGIPSLWSGLRDRRAQQERAERERRQSDALIEASNRVKQLNERYNSLMQALQGMKGNTNVVNSNPELVAELGSAFAPAAGAGQAASVASGTAVNIFGHEVSKQVLYQAIGGMLGGYMGGMQVANNARAERQLRMQREKLEAEGRAFGAEMEARQREYEKALGEISSSKEKTVMRQLEKSRIREDANDAFMQYVDGGFDGNLADIIGGFYGEGALPKGFV